MARAILAALAGAACGALISACWSSGPVVRTQAVAFANAVNLHTSDTPGMGTLAPGFVIETGPPFGSCTTRFDRSEEVVAVDSPWFLRSRDQRQVRFGDPEHPPVEATHSAIYVMREAALASQNVSAARRAGAPACVQRSRARESSGRSIGRESYERQIQASSLPFPLRGVPGYGLRVSGTFAASLFHQRTRPVFYDDTYAFAVGPAEIVLHANGVGKPFSAAMERRLLSLLYRRAKAHALS